MNPMITTHIKHFVIALLALMVATSCTKDELPEKNEVKYADLTYFAKASGSGVKRIGTTSNTVAVKWSSASIYVDKIAFEGKQGNKQIDTTISVKKNIDIFNANALTGIVQLPTGSYKDVKVKLLARKSEKSELAFNLKGTFLNTKGVTDSVMVGSSYPFEANLNVTDLVITSSDQYNVNFIFNLDKVLTGISTEQLQTARSYTTKNNGKLYVIWKGGSDEEPFYDQVIQNWQTVASVIVTLQ